METSISPLFLRTFRKAYELKNFTETAQKLGMTQSGVSQHVAQIEEILGASLFERVGRRICPTLVADRLYSFGGSWLAQMEELIHEVREEEQKLSGRIILGAPGSFGVYLLKSLVDWQRENPGLIIEFEYGPNSIMERELRSGRMDLAITSEPLDARAFVSKEFFSEEYVLVSHPNLKPKFDTWEDFRKNPIVDYVGSEPIFQKWISAHYKKHTSYMEGLNVRARLNNMESIFFLLQQKVGITIFPSESLLDLVQKKALKVHKTQKRVTNSLYLVHRQGQVLSRRTHALQDLIINFTNETTI